MAIEIEKYNSGFIRTIKVLDNNGLLSNPNGFSFVEMADYGKELISQKFFIKGTEYSFSDLKREFSMCGGVGVLDYVDPNNSRRTKVAYQNSIKQQKTVYFEDFKSPASVAYYNSVGELKPDSYDEANIILYHKGSDVIKSQFLFDEKEELWREEFSLNGELVTETKTDFLSQRNYVV